MMATVGRLPVVVVLGATGTGKSKLAIELGRKFNGEIVSADSMQIYKGLDIITNKVTAEEQHQCPHHLISYVNPFNNTSNTVVQFRDKALPIIDRLLDEGKLPIIVGGTNYYIESLLWKFLIDKKIYDGHIMKIVWKRVQQDPFPNDLPDMTLTVDEVKVETPPTKKVRTSESMEDPDTCEGQGEQPSEGRTVRSAAGESDSQTLNQDPTDLSVHGSHCKQESTTDASSSNPDSSTPVMDVKDMNSDFSDVSDTEDGIISGRTTESGDGKERVDRGGKFSNIDSSELHNRLMLVDPVSAKKIHPHNRRKVIRALEVHEDHGVPMSEIYKAQHSTTGDAALSGPLRYPHTCIFWIQCDKTVLDERLDKRVDGMMQQGLIQELHDFHRQYRQAMKDDNRMCDYTLGMFQSIGFKEFHNYLLLPEGERDTVKGRQLRVEGLESLKLATRQYARRQMKWVRNRFLKRPGPGVPPVYGVDSTDVSQWTDNVFNPACDVLTAIIQGETSSLSPLKLEGEVTRHVHNVCEVCGGRVFTTQREWDAHLSSRKHKKAFSKQQKRARESGCPPDESTALPDGDIQGGENPKGL